MDSFEELKKEYLIDLKCKNRFIPNRWIEEVENLEMDYKSIDSAETYKDLYDSFYLIDIDILEFDRSGEEYPPEWLVERHQRFIEIADSINDSDIVYSDF